MYRVMPCAFTAIAATACLPDAAHADMAIGGVGLGDIVRLATKPDYYAAAGGSLIVIHDQVDQELEQSFDYGNLSAVTLKGGARVHRYLSFEAEASVGVFEHDAIELFSESQVKLDSLYTVAAVGRLPVTDNAELTARIGYSTVDITAEFNDILAGSGQSNLETDGVSYGVGFDHDVGEKWGVTGDVTVLQGNARILQQRVAAVSIALRRRF